MNVLHKKWTGLGFEPRTIGLCAQRADHCAIQLHHFQQVFYTSQGTSRVLVARRRLTNLIPNHLVHNQTFQHLSHFVIIVHVIVSSESIQKMLHALSFGSIDQIHQGLFSTALWLNSDCKLCPLCIWYLNDGLTTPWSGLQCRTRPARGGNYPWDRKSVV